MTSGSNQIRPADGEFTLAQWQQLQLQQKVLKYIRARLRVPVDLIARLGCQHDEHNCCLQSHCYNCQGYQPYATTTEIQGHISRTPPSEYNRGPRGDNGRKGSKRSRNTVADQTHCHEEPNKKVAHEVRVGEPSQLMAPTTYLQLTHAPVHDLSTGGSVDSVTRRPSSRDATSEEKTESDDLSISQSVDGTNNRSSLPIPSLPTIHGPSSSPLILPLPIETPKGLAPFETENASVATETDDLSIFQPVHGINIRSSIHSPPLPTCSGPSFSPLVLALPTKTKNPTGLAPFEAENACVDSSATQSDDLSIPPVDGINHRSSILTPSLLTSLGPSSSPLVLALPTKSKNHQGLSTI